MKSMSIEEMAFCRVAQVMVRDLNIAISCMSEKWRFSPLNPKQVLIEKRYKICQKAFRITKKWQSI